jgi:propanol-preferring alcohol dehydrogenase
MRAAVLPAPEARLSIVDRDVPEPGPGEVLLAVSACGMCFSEVPLVHGGYPFAHYPVIPGHEVIGTVEAVGPGVEWPEVGAVAGAQFLYSSCGHCDYCVGGNQILCAAKRITGVSADGGYAEYLLAKAPFVTPLPDGMDRVRAAPLMCAGITAFNGLRQGGAHAGSRVAVLGLGGVGGMAVRFAVAMGARVAVVARSARDREQAERLGAELFVASADEDAAAALKRWHGGANLIVNTVPTNAMAEAALGGIAQDGTLVLLGYGHGAPLQLPAQAMVLNRIHVMGNPSGSPHDMRDTLEFAHSHGILPEVTPVALDDAPEILAGMVDGTGRTHGRSVIAF